MRTIVRAIIAKINHRELLHRGRPRACNRL